MGSPCCCLCVCEFPRPFTVNLWYHSMGLLSFQCLYVDGGRYVGQWANDVRCGHGEHWFPNGAHYVGDWQDNTMHGLGVWSGPPYPAACASGYTASPRTMDSGRSAVGSARLPLTGRSQGVGSMTEREGVVAGRSTCPVHPRPHTPSCPLACCACCALLCCAVLCFETTARCTVLVAGCLVLGCLM